MKVSIGVLSRYGGWFVVAFIFLYLIVLVFATWPITSFTGKDLEKMGQLGDSFGFLTAVFTALALWVALRLLHQNSVDMEMFRQQAHLSYLVEKSKLQPDFDYEVSYDVSDHVFVISWDRYMATEGIEVPEKGFCMRIAHAINSSRNVYFDLNLIVDFEDGASLRSGSWSSEVLQIPSNKGPIFFLNIDEVANIQSSNKFKAFLTYKDATMLTTILLIEIQSFAVTSAIIKCSKCAFVEPGTDISRLDTFVGCSEIFKRYHNSEQL